ncbi:MAG TPA: DUF2383 domain-containing protein, partial [Pseudomonas sp.]|nr:DUF2383 domain-containing protein [Pseudomonas sp.]
MPTLDKTIAGLHHLLVACQDGQYRYALFARQAVDPQLRQFFTRGVAEMAASSACLRQQIAAYGGRPARHRGVCAAL